MFSKAVALGQQGKGEEAIMAYDALVERFATEEDETIVHMVVKALIFKGVALGRANRLDEARNVFNRAMAISPDNEHVQKMADLVLKGGSIPAPSV